VEQEIASGSDSGFVVELGLVALIEPAHLGFSRPWFHDQDTFQAFKKAVNEKRKCIQ
jgi:hypothetical protein